MSRDALCSLIGQAKSRDSEAVFWLVAMVITWCGSGTWRAIPLGPWEEKLQVGAGEGEHCVVVPSFVTVSSLVCSFFLFLRRTCSLFWDLIGLLSHVWWARIGCLLARGWVSCHWLVLSRRVFHLERFEEEHVRGGEKRESCEKETEFEEEAQR